MSNDLFTISWFILFILVIFIAFIANMIIILAILRDKSMYTSTYFYIINVSIADLILVLSCLPERIAAMIYSNSGFHLGRYTCYLLPFLQQVSMHAALGFLLILTVHRCYPAGVPRCLQGNFIRKQIRRYPNTLCVIWIFAILINVPLFFLTTYQTPLSNDGINQTEEILSTSCETEAREIWSRLYLIVLLVLTYLITGIFLVIIYGQVIRIILHTKKYRDRTHLTKEFQFFSQEKFRPTATSSSNSSSKSPQRHSIVSPINQIKSPRTSNASQHLQVIIMLFVVILLYIILLLPYRLLNLLFIVSNELFQTGFINEILFQWLLNIVRLLVVLNCALQPIIYMIISSRLRQTVMKFFQWKTFCRCQCSISIDDQEQFKGENGAVQAYLVQKHQHVNRLFNQPKKVNSRNDFLPPVQQQQLIDYRPLVSMRAYPPVSNFSGKSPYTVTFKTSLRR